MTGGGINTVKSRYLSILSSNRIARFIIWMLKELEANIYQIT